MKTIPVADWIAQGKQLFGDDTKEWKFRCPACGNVQTLVDFEKVGAEPQLAYQECIGRKLPTCARHFGSTPGTDGKKSPCDYAAFGLFRLGGTQIVLADNGTKVAVLPFAEIDKTL